MYDPVVKGAAYILVHVPNMAFEFGSTQDVERHKDPQSPYLTEFKKHLRTYEQVLGYAPFQAFIGNMHPDELTSIPRPWYEGDKVEAKRYADGTEKSYPRTSSMLGCGWWTRLSWCGWKISF
jgi:hypothetical protein